MPDFPDQKRRRLLPKRIWGEAKRETLIVTPRRRVAGPAFALCGALVAAFGLSGCVETAAQLAPAADAHAQFVRRPDVSLSGASVAFVSIDGPPAAVSASFSQMLTREAAAHDIVVDDAKKARYLVRGYLSADATADGVSVEYVWDVFNKDRQRTQRVSDAIALKGDGSSDPWRMVSEAALASVAAKSADDLAAFLSNTPEAVAIAAPTAAEGKPLSYAPVD